eukprot:CCRYP_018936-RA/>CCRYP_018936-RA protein AED:0.22 eAED:0.20 QI:0/0/0/1/1/1/2/0/637
MSTTALKQGIMNGSIASAVSDTRATSTAGAPHDPFEETTTISSKVFFLPTGSTAKATKVAKLLHKVQTPANIVDIVPSLGQTLLSGSKFADAGYTAVYDKAEVNFYDANTIHITEKADLYTDQTGKFPHVSSRGFCYQMILYHVASNSIWVEPTKNRTEGELILARSQALRMKACDITPQHQVLDNEISAAYRDAITTSAMTYQLVPPDDHRRNIAEKAIQTWKDHFISALSGTADNFPSTSGVSSSHKWSANSTYSDNQTAIPRYHHMHTFTATMTTTLTHLFLSEWRHWSMTNLTAEKSFAQHCMKGFVLGNSTEHYCCWTVWTPVSRSTRISATVFFKHKYITNPTVTPADAIIAATANLAHVLMSNTTAAHLNATQLADLTQLHKIIQPMSTAKSAVSPTVNTTQPTAPKRNTAHPIVSDSDSDTSLQSSKSTPPRPLYTPGQPIARSPRVTIPPPQMNNTASPRVSPHTAPAYNTRSCKQTITQETMLHFSQLPAPTFTAQRAASRLFPTDFLNAILNEDTGELMEYRHLIKDPKYSTIWKKAYSKELGRLAQGIPGIVQGTNTIVFIAKDDVPPNRRRDVTYGCICTNFRYVSPSVATESTFQATAAPPQPTCSQLRSSSTASFQPEGHDS